MPFSWPWLSSCLDQDAQHSVGWCQSRPFLAPSCSCRIPPATLQTFSWSPDACPVGPFKFRVIRLDSLLAVAFHPPLPLTPTHDRPTSRPTPSPHPSRQRICWILFARNTPYELGAFLPLLSYRFDTIQRDRSGNYSSL